ncbi:hypothetical protein FBQ97_13315 [Acidobacteria bacterium ACD]|nr:hypothetical protein [Acidobacteria bacterium ACD]
MLDFSLLRDRRMTLGELVQGLTVDDLRDLTNEMIDYQLRLIADCEDADVTFVPDDPAAEDKYAANVEEINLPWTLGHVIVHVTASSEGERASATGGFLFTHRGYSGPAVLDVSHVVERALLSGRPFRVTAGFGPGGDGALPDWDEEIRTGAGTLAGFLSRRLPDRLVVLLLAEAGVADLPLHRLPREARRRAAEALSGLLLPVSGTEGYRTAEVTGGGVALEEVDPGSGESRLVPGLFLAGELLDAFGPIGGFNFQWAWATGATAGTGAARSLIAAR